MGQHGTRLDGLPTLDECEAVRTERRVRSVRFDGDSFSVTINPDWAQDLGLDEGGAAIDERCIAISDYPVVINEPALLILPEGGER